MTGTDVYAPYILYWLILTGLLVGVWALIELLRWVGIIHYYPCGRDYDDPWDTLPAPTKQERTQ